MSNFKSKISQAKSLKDIFDTVNEFYHTEQPVGSITMSLIKSKVDLLISASRVKPKK